MGGALGGSGGPAGAGAESTPLEAPVPASPLPDDVPALSDLFPEEPSGALTLEPSEGVDAKAVRVRVRAKRPEGREATTGPGDLPEQDPPLPPPPEVPPAPTRMLCLGTPFRSKKGKEVCGAVQATINRLEAAQFWPLAVLHASTWHWMCLAQDLGISQPFLLPFGLIIHARRRMKSGYGSHWTTRTVPGKYLGQAPNTPGGHFGAC